MFVENTITEYEETKNNSFDCFTFDNEQQLLKTPYGDIPYKYYQNHEPVLRAIDVTKVLGYVNADQAIRAHVRERHCIPYHNLNEDSTSTDLRGPIESIGSLKGFWI